MSKRTKLKLSFTPCDDRCPAVTGKPEGSRRYCPMQEHDRHRTFETGPHRESRAWRRDPKKPGAWHTYDWRVGRWIKADMEKTHPVPRHPDQTDCCLNFQCCVDYIK